MSPLGNSSSPRSLAQEAVSWYLDQLKVAQSHALNVKAYLRGPVIALTTAVFSHGPSALTSEVAAASSQSQNWRGYLNLQGLDGKDGSLSLQELFAPDSVGKKYAAMSPRAKARLEAFLEGVTLAVAPEEPSQKVALSQSKRTENTSFSLLEGLVGFRSPDVAKIEGTKVESFTSTSSAMKSHQKSCQQLAEFELVTRLELYLRSLYRVVAHKNECVIALEPSKALKARTRSIVAAFVETVGTVRHVSPVLTRLLTALTKELLAVGTLSEDLSRGIRNIVSSYVHATSFASLAFLSSPESSADQRLTPAILKYLLYLQSYWEKCVFDCEVEVMLSAVLNPAMRHMFKTAEFQSIGHLLEVYQGFRDELHNIELPPRITEESQTNEEAQLGQAIKDIQREVIAVNGTILPHVTSRSDLLQLLTTSLSAGTLFDRVPLRRRNRRRRTTIVQRNGEDSDDYLSSGNEADFSGNFSETSASESGKLSGQEKHRRRSTFRLSTVDLLTKRLLMAASRTGTGGDAYFVVRDLFGGEDVEVVPSQYQPGAIRPATIDLLVRLASVTIKSHSSYDVYPKSMVGETEPLIQIHTTTTESIALQEVRSSVNSDGTTEVPAEMILQERPTENGGYRALSIRPALYEKVSVWHTPS